MGTVLLVDFSNTLYRSLHVHGHLSHRGQYTGGLYGLVAQIASVVNAHSAEHVLICTDTKPYFRTKLYPKYKFGRHKNDDPEFIKLLKQSKQLCLEFFDRANIPVWSVPGYECDDLIAIATRRMADKDRAVVIRSNDSDLWQLLNKEKNIVIDRGTKGNGLMTYSVFRKEYKISPKQWPWVAALAGSHNALPGLPGVGLKTALKIISDKEKLAQYREQYPKLDLFYSLARLPYNEKISEMPALTSMRSRTAERWLLSKGFEISPVIGQAFDRLV